MYASFEEEDLRRLEDYVLVDGEVVGVEWVAHHAFINIFLFMFMGDNWYDVDVNYCSK